jgi:hypothetical protein
MNLQQSQYNSIGIVAKHCDLSKLLVAENEASNFDLAELFCDFWVEIETIANEIQSYEIDEDPDKTEPTNYAEKKALLNGGVYLDCSEKQRPFEGIYKIMAYYSYARYIVLNGFNDTATGMVTKTNEFSIPKTLKELESFADKYRNMGKISFDRTVRYICKNSAIFDYSHCPTDGCGCGSEKCGSTRAKGYGFKSRNISK